MSEQQRLQLLTDMLMTLMAPSARDRFRGIEEQFRIAKENHKETCDYDLGWAAGRKAALEEAILVVMSFCQACETGRGSANSTAHKIRQAIEQMPLENQLKEKD